jgi:hypothetical protein
MKGAGLTAGPSMPPKRPAKSVAFRKPLIVNGFATLNPEIIA